MTLNNYTQDDIDTLRGSIKSDSPIKYITFIKEIGESGTPHLQIYAQSSTKLSIKAWHEHLGPKIANIVPTLHQERAIKYCQGYEWNEETKEYTPKEGSDLSSMEEYGTPPSQGQRNDILSVVQELKKRTFKQIVLDEEMNEHATTIAKFSKHFQHLDDIYKTERMYQGGKSQHLAYTQTLGARKPWEMVLDDIISKPADPRIIHWFYDEIGNTGKTVNAKTLMYEHNAFYTTGGKAADIYHAYEGEPIVVLNLPASIDPETHAYLYTVLESFKDGVLSSGKYNSKTKSFDIPHVIVFSNIAPDTTRVKRSRIEAHNINKIYKTIKRLRIEIPSPHSLEVDQVEYIDPKGDFMSPGSRDALIARLNL